MVSTFFGALLERVECVTMVGGGQSGSGTLQTSRTPTSTSLNYGATTSPALASPATPTVQSGAERRLFSPEEVKRLTQVEERSSLLFPKKHQNVLKPVQSVQRAGQ